MEIKTFDEAVKFCCERFRQKPVNSDGLIEVCKLLHKMSAGGRSYTLKPGEKAEDIYMEEPKKEIKIENERIVFTFTGEESEHLVDKSKEDRLAYIAAKELAADIITEGKSLPKPLATFVAGILKDTINPPVKTRRRLDNLDRDNKIYHTIKELKKGGYRPITRNDESPPYSACDAVLEGLKTINIYMDYQAVKKIYQQKKKSFRQYVESRSVK